MAEVLEEGKGAGVKPSIPVPRLCNEIQLFDLCELEKCGFKRGPHCTDQDLLDRFEAIAEADERPAVAGFISDELDDEMSDEEEFDDGIDDYYDDEGYEED